MKKIVILFAAFVFSLGAKPAQAVVFVDAVSFSPQAVIDTQSGTGIDFTYEHILSELSGSGLGLTSAELSLTHFGNVDEGPTREVWFALTGGGKTIGRLSKSDLHQVTDTWQLNNDILGEMTGTNPWRLQVGLSEQTPFNSERVDLYQSELKVNYEKIPTTPEPWLISILPLGAAIFGLFRRRQGL